MSNKLLTWKQRRAEIKEKLMALNEKAAEEARDFDEAEQAKWDDLTEESQRLSKQIERYEVIGEMPNKPEPEMRSEPQAPAYHPRRTADTEEAIYCRYIRTGDPGAAAELGTRETRASNDTTMNITTDADGGYLVPTGHYRGIVERARPRALPFLLQVMNIPGQGTTVNVPIDNETDSGVFVSTAESNAFDRDAPAVSQIAMTLVKYTKKVDLTYELLQDEDSRLMTFLESYVGAGYAATLNSLMVAEALSDGTAGLTLDSASAIGIAEIPELLYKLTSEYAMGNIAWLMERATEGYLRGLNSANTFAFAPWPGSTSDGRTAGDLFGVPLYTDENMGTLTASGKSLLVADWGYMGMRLDPTMTLLRDPYTRSSYGEVILNYYFRADFEVLQAAAFQYATHPTA